MLVVCAPVASLVFFCELELCATHTFYQVILRVKMENFLKVQNKQKYLLHLVFLVLIFNLIWISLRNVKGFILSPMLCTHCFLSMCTVPRVHSLLLCMSCFSPWELLCIWAELSWGEGPSLGMYWVFLTCYEGISPVLHNYKNDGIFLLIYWIRKFFIIWIIIK